MLIAISLYKTQQLLFQALVVPAGAPTGASRDAEQRSNKASDYRAVGGIFRSRLEAAGLPAALPDVGDNGKRCGLRQGA
ncbi:hypothetical protein Q427_26875 [Halomonas sp. BC04]|nr:hypothetical protein Q427_26875 [Halomonas sp. BC04]